VRCFLFVVRSVAHCVLCVVWLLAVCYSVIDCCVLCLLFVGCCSCLMLAVCCCLFVGFCCLAFVVVC